MTDYTGSLNTLSPFIQAEFVGREGVRSLDPSLAFIYTFGEVDASVGVIGPTVQFQTSEPDSIGTVIRGVISLEGATPEQIRSRLWSFNGILGSDTITISGFLISMPGNIVSSPVSIDSSRFSGVIPIRAGIDAIESTMLVIAGGGAPDFYYKMRGYRPGTQDFEVWVDTTPNSANPSGLPIVNVQISILPWNATT